MNVVFCKNFKAKFISYSAMLGLERLSILYRYNNTYTQFSHRHPSLRKLAAVLALVKATLRAPAATLTGAVRDSAINPQAGTEGYAAAEQKD